MKGVIGGGHKSNNSKRKQRERWNARHPSGRKKYSHRRRDHTPDFCPYVREEFKKK